MSVSVALLSKLFRCVAVCSAFTVFIRSSDAARARITTAQEENGGKPDTWSPLYNLHISDNSHPFTKGPLPILIENGFGDDDEMQNGHLNRKDSLLNERRPAQPLFGSIGYNQRSSDDRHIHFQPRILRGNGGSGTNVMGSPTSFHNSYSRHRTQTTEGQQTGVKPPLLPTQATSTIKISSAFGRQQSAPSSRDSIQKFFRPGSLSGGRRPVLHKATQWGNFTVVSPPHHGSNLQSSENPNDLSGTYNQGNIPQIKSLVVIESQGHDQANYIVPETVLQSSDPSLFLSQSDGNVSPQSAVMHHSKSLISRTSTQTNEFALPRMWTVSNGVQSGHFPVIASHQTVSHAPSISKSLDNSVKKLSPRPEKQPTQITNVYGAHPLSNNEKPPYRPVQSYLFKDPQIASVRHETVNSDREKPRNEMNTPLSPSVQSPPSSLVYSSHSSFNQLRSSDREDASSDVQYPSINSNIYHKANVALHGGLSYSNTISDVSKSKILSKPQSVNTANMPPSPSSEKWKAIERSVTVPLVFAQASFDPDGKKPVVRSSVNTLQHPRFMADLKPPRSVNNIHGFRGLEHRPRWSTHDEKEDSSLLPFSSKKNSNGKANSQPYVFDKNTDSVKESVTSSFPVFQKYHFGQRPGAAAEMSLAKTERTPTGYSEPNAYVNDAAKPVSKSSAFDLNGGSFRKSKFKTSANVFASLRRPIQPKSSPSPTSLLDNVQTVPVSKPRWGKPSFKDVWPTQPKNNANLGYDSNLRQMQNYIGGGAVRGFPAVRSAGSKQKEGAKASDISAIKTVESTAIKTGGFRFSSLQSGQPKHGINHRRYEPFSLKVMHDPNPEINRKSSVQEEEDVLTAGGKDTKTEVILQSGSIRSIPDSSRPPEHETPTDESTSHHIFQWKFKPEISVLGPTEHDGMTSESNVNSTYEMSNILTGKTFSIHPRTRGHDGDQGSKVVSGTSVTGGHLGSNADKMAPAKTKPISTNVTSAPDLNSQTGEGVELSLKKTERTESVRHPVNKPDGYKNKWKSFAFLKFPSARNKTNKRPWKYEEHRTTTPAPAPRNSSAHPKSAGDLKNRPSSTESTPTQKQMTPGVFKPLPLNAAVLGGIRATNGRAIGKRVKGKLVKEESHAASANATFLANDIRAVPITRGSRPPLRVEAFTYDDVLGITSFSGVRTVTASNVIDSIKQNAGALGKGPLKLQDVDAYLDEKNAAASLIHPGLDQVGGRTVKRQREETEGVLGDFIAVDKGKLGVENERTNEDGKRTPAGGDDDAAGQEAGTTMDPLLEMEEGSGSVNGTDVLPAVSSDASEKTGTPTGEMLELDYLRT